MPFFPDSRNEIGAKDLLLDLKKFGGWPMIEKEWSVQDFDWVDLIIQLFKNGHSSYDMFFSIKVDLDIMNTSRNLIWVSIYFYLNTWDYINEGGTREL